MTHLKQLKDFDQIEKKALIDKGYGTGQVGDKAAFYMACSPYMASIWRVHLIWPVYGVFTLYGQTTGITNAIRWLFALIAKQMMDIAGMFTKYRRQMLLPLTAYNFTV